MHDYDAENWNTNKVRADATKKQSGGSLYHVNFVQVKSERSVHVSMSVHGTWSYFVSHNLSSKK